MRAIDRSAWPCSIACISPVEARDVSAEASLASLVRESDEPGYETEIKEHLFSRHAECPIGIPSIGR